MNINDLKWMGKYYFVANGRRFLGQVESIYADSLSINELSPSGSMHIRTTTFPKADLKVIDIYVENETRVQIGNWDKQIKALEKHFACIMKEQQKLLNQKLQLNDHSVIRNVSRMVNTHLQIVKTNNGNPIYMPYLERLIQLSKLI